MPKIMLFPVSRNFPCDSFLKTQFSKWKPQITASCVSAAYIYSTITDTKDLLGTLSRIHSCITLTPQCFVVARSSNSTNCIFGSVLSTVLRIFHHNHAFGHLLSQTTHGSLFACSLGLWRYGGPRNTCLSPEVIPHPKSPRRGQVQLLQLTMHL